ncbi:MAG: beta-galactosidase [Clostridia bacterium]|nr:beta-galactosidase [Clostridia bacterium]
MKFEICGKDFIKDGKRIKIISGAVHYFRNLPDTWDDIFEKMVACGFNTVETYCAWNMHEKTKGRFDFSAQYDIALFLEKAQKHGLMAIVRPGPYICAEWEFGGLPWWLQAEEDMEIRCLNATYIRYFERYLDELFAQIKPYLATNGGNVVMLQVENEYGHYGDDKAYLAHLVKTYRAKGIDVPLFTSDGTNEPDLLDGTTDGCLSTINFGSRVEERFQAHDSLFPDIPKMCMELWNGWFDAWGDEKHHTTDAQEYAHTVDDMLKRGSMNAYMFIGGTNFGFTSGANHYETYAPDVTSYDYDALLTECGDVTEKYCAVREVIQKYTDKPLPPIPKNRQKCAYGQVRAVSSTKLLDNLDVLSAPVTMNAPKTMEDLGFGYGYVVYQTRLNRDYDNVKMVFDGIGDRAQIYVNTRCCGTIYVNDSTYEVDVTAKTGDSLSVVCENMGRTNFGPKMMYKKGIVGRCLLGYKIHFGWTAYHLPMDNLDKLSFEKGVVETAGETFYRFQFDVNGAPCDTFLRTDNFTKGFVTLNGFNLGRYWAIGPQKTLYVPASILKEGKNELIVFESDGLKGEPIIEFVDKPELG